MGFDKEKQLALAFLHLLIAGVLSATAFNFAVHMNAFMFGAIASAMNLNGYFFVKRYLNWSAYK